MTVIEHEPVTITPTETEDDPAIRVLRTIRDKFASGEWRWIQAAATDGSNGYCLIGAIKQATDGEMSGAWSPSALDLVSRLEFRLGLGAQGGRRVPLYCWNDGVGRRLPHVLRLLDEEIGA